MVILTAVVILTAPAVCETGFLLVAVPSPLESTRACIPCSRERDHFKLIPKRTLICLRIAVTNHNLSTSLQGGICLAGVGDFNCPGPEGFFPCLTYRCCKGVVGPPANAGGQPAPPPPKAAHSRTTPEKSVRTPLSETPGPREVLMIQESNQRDNGPRTRVRQSKSPLGEPAHIAQSQPPLHKATTKEMFFFLSSLQHSYPACSDPGWKRSQRGPRCPPVNLLCGATSLAKTSLKGQ